MLREVIAGNDALVVVAADDAEDVRAPFIGEPRIGRRRGHHDHARSLVERRSGDGGARADVPDKNVTPSLISFRAAAPACSVSHASSTEINRTCSPSTPPLALSSAIASS